MAFRCLPIATRELFENTITSSGDYPTIEVLLKCVKSRVFILEIISDSRSGNFSSQSKSSRPSNRKGDRSSNSDHQHAASLITTKPERSCPFCKAHHKLETCEQFLALAVSERSDWMREHSLCFNCFSDSHWSNRCRSKPGCKHCSRNRHTLLHTNGRNTKEKTTEPNPKSSLCASHPVPTASTSSSVLLGRALVHVQDRSGTWKIMRVQTTVLHR